MKYIPVNALQDKTNLAGTLPGINQECLVYMATSIALGGYKLAIEFELLRNGLDVSDQYLPDPKVAKNRSRRYADR